MQQPRQDYRRLLIPLWLCLLLLSSMLPANAIVNAAARREAAATTGAEFTYNGPGYTLTYRFTPNLGTLNDLRAVYNNNFTFAPSIGGGIYEVLLAGELFKVVPNVKTKNQQK